MFLIAGVQDIFYFLFEGETCLPLDIRLPAANLPIITIMQLTADKLAELFGFLKETPRLLDSLPN